jgi:superfamily II DNA or RNA helicase
MMIDFTGFHPYIVANLVEYKVPEEETIYEHLAKYYFNIVNVTADDIGKSKKLTMVNLYGQISNQYCDIPYFHKVEQLKDKYWKKFEKNGYITTPIYKRKITNKHIVDANKNKLFAYIIQAAETEYGIDSLSKCIKFVSNKKIVPILYVYDSIVFDIHNDVDRQDITDLIEIFKNKRFKVKTYTGNNYNDLKLVQL